MVKTLHCQCRGHLVMELRSHMPWGMAKRLLKKFIASPSQFTLLCLFSKKEDEPFVFPLPTSMMWCFLSRGVREMWQEEGAFLPAPVSPLGRLHAASMAFPVCSSCHAGNLSSARILPSRQHPGSNTSSGTPLRLLAAHSPVRSGF